MGAAVSSPGAPPLGADANPEALQQQQQQSDAGAAAAAGSSDSSISAAAAAAEAQTAARADFPPSPMECNRSPAAEYSRVLLQRLLPQAAAAGDVWLRFCCFWLAGHYSLAFDALLPPYAGALQQEQQHQHQQQQQQQKQLLPFNPRTYLQGTQQQQQQQRRPTTPPHAGSGAAAADTFAAAAKAGTAAAAAGAAAGEEGSYEGGCWRVSPPSLSLCLFRAAIRQTLPMRRAQQKHKERHQEQLQQRRPLVESFYTPDDNSGSSSNSSSSNSSSSSSRMQWTTCAEGSRIDFPTSGFDAHTRRSSSSSTTNTSKRRICCWGFADPAGAAESDMYLLSCLYTRERQPFLAAVAAVSLLSLHAARRALVEALEEGPPMGGPQEAPLRGLLLPDAALPTVWGALHAFAAAAAPALLFSAALEQQQQQQKHQLMCPAAVSGLLDLQPSVLLLLTAAAWRPLEETVGTDVGSGQQKLLLLQQEQQQGESLPPEAAENALLLLLSSLDSSLRVYSSTQRLLLPPLLQGVSCSSRALLSQSPFRSCCHPTDAAAATAAAAAEEVQEALSLPLDVPPDLSVSFEGPASSCSTAALTSRRRDRRHHWDEPLRQAVARVSFSLCLRVAASPAAVAATSSNSSSSSSSMLQLQCPWVVQSALYELLLLLLQRGSRRLGATAAAAATAAARGFPSPSASLASLGPPEGPPPGGPLETETDAAISAVSSQLVAVAHAQLLAAANAAADARRVVAAAALAQQQQEQQEGLYSSSVLVAGLTRIPPGAPAAAAAAAPARFTMPVLLPLLLQLLRDTLEMPSVHPKSLGIPALYCCLTSCVTHLQHQAQRDCCCSCSSCSNSSKCSSSTVSSSTEGALSLHELQRLYSIFAVCCCGFLLAVVSSFPPVFAPEGSPLLQHGPFAAAAAAAGETAYSRSSSSGSSKTPSSSSSSEDDRALLLAYRIAELLQLILSRPRCLLLQQDVLLLLQELLQPRWIPLPTAGGRAVAAAGAAAAAAGPGAAAAASAPAFALAACVAVRCLEFLLETLQAVLAEGQQTAVAALAKHTLLLQQEQQQHQQLLHQQQTLLNKPSLLEDEYNHMEQQKRQQQQQQGRRAATAAAAAAEAEEAYSLCSSLLSLNGSLVEFLCTHLRPVFFKSLLPAAAGLLPLLCDIRPSAAATSGAAAAAAAAAAGKRASLLSTAAESWGGQGLGSLFNGLACSSRVQWVLQHTSFLPLQQLPAPALLQPLHRRDQLLQGVRLLSSKYQQQQQQQQQQPHHEHHHSHHVHRDGGTDSHVQGDEVQQQLQLIQQQQQQQHLLLPVGYDAAGAAAAGGGRDRQATTPSVGSLTPKASSRRFNSCFPPLDGGHKQQQQQQQHQPQQIMSTRVAEHILAATCLPALPIVATALFPGCLVQTACCSSNSSNAFEIVRHSRTIGPLPHQQQQQQQQQEDSSSRAGLHALAQEWGAVPLAALLGPVTAAASSSSSSRHSSPAGLNVSGEVVASVCTLEGPPRGLRSLCLPQALLGLSGIDGARCAAAVAAAAAAAEARYREAVSFLYYKPLQQQQQQQEATGDVTDIPAVPLVSDVCGAGGAFPCLLRSRRPMSLSAAATVTAATAETATAATAAAATAAAAAAVPDDESGSLRLPRQSPHQQRQHYIRRGGLAEWVGLLLSRDTSLYTITQASRLCSYSRLLARVTDSSNISSRSSSSSSPVFPYGAFSPLSAMRSAFDFSGVVAAHPFLPVFAALLRAPQGPPHGGAPSILTPVLRPFGPGARSLPRPPPPAATVAAAAAAGDGTVRDLQRMDTMEPAAAEAQQQQQQAKKGLHALPLMLRPPHAQQQQLPQQQQQQQAASGSPRKAAAAAAAGAAAAALAAGAPTGVDVTSAAWVPQGDSLLVADIAGWAYLFCLLRGPLLSPSVVAEALSASAAAAAAAAAVTAAARAAAAGISITANSNNNNGSSSSSSYDLQQQRACRPAVCWRAHNITLQIAAADGSGCFVVTLGIGVQQQLLQHETSLIPGAAAPRSLLQRLGSGDSSGCEAAGAVAAGSNRQYRSISSSSSNTGGAHKGKSRRRPHVLRLLGGPRTATRQGLVSRLLHSRIFASRIPAAAAGRQQTAAAAAAAPAAAPFVGGALRSLAWRAKAFRASTRGPRGFLRGLGAPLSAAGGPKAAAAAATKQQQQQQQQGDDGEEAWLDSGSWASGFWGLGSLVTSVAEISPNIEGADTPEGGPCCSMPSIGGPCLCVWQLTSVGPSGAPRLLSVITCDDLLHTRARLAAAAAAAPSGAKATKRHQAAAAAEGTTWPIEPTHTPSCFCMAVLQEGPACCTACLAAAAGCTGSCCSSSLSATCCDGSCAALRCVVYGDTEGTVHAVELGLEEEVLRWGAHPGAPIVSVSASRACGWGSAAPEVWLVTAAAAAGSSSTTTTTSGGMVLRCWSMVGLGEGGPVLLHQLNVTADAVLPPGVSLHPQGPPGRHGAAAESGGGTQSAIARFLGATQKKGDTNGDTPGDIRQAGVFPLGGRSALVVEGGELLLLARV